MRIDSGPLTATLSLHDVPPEKWLEFVRLRRDYLAVRLQCDCRNLVGFIRDGEAMWPVLGYSSLDVFVRLGLELAP